MRSEIHLEGDLDKARRKRLLEIATLCAVHRTLSSEIKIRTGKLGPQQLRYPASIPPKPRPIKKNIPRLPRNLKKVPRRFLYKAYPAASSTANFSIPHALRFPSLNYFHTGRLGSSVSSFLKNG